MIGFDNQQIGKIRFLAGCKHVVTINDMRYFFIIIDQQYPLLGLQVLAIFLYFKEIGHRRLNPKSDFAFLFDNFPDKSFCVTLMGSFAFFTLVVFLRLLCHAHLQLLVL